MRRFRKNPLVKIVVVPPHGRVYDGDVLEGDHYALFCPALLLEIVEAVPAATPAPEPTPEPVVEAPVEPVAVEEVAVPVTVEDEPVNSPPVEVTATIEPSITDAPVKRKRGRPKKIQTG